MSRMYVLTHLHRLGLHCIPHTQPATLGCPCKVAKVHFFYAMQETPGPVTAAVPAAAAAAATTPRGTTAAASSVVGLNNLGNTCFFNSSVQLLLSCEPLQQQLVGDARPLAKGPLGYALQQAFVNINGVCLHMSPAS